MARVTITPLNPGDNRAAATANATIGSWNTNSSNIDDNNFRDEAFDRRSIKKEFHEFGGTIRTQAHDGVLQTITSLALIEMVSPFHIGGFDFTLNEDEIVVRLSLEAFGNWNAFPGQEELTVALGSKVGSGGVATLIPSTARVIQLDNASALDVHKSITLTHRFTVGTNSNWWFTLMAKVSSVAAGARAWDIRNVVLTAVLFKR